jgi:hypothetical protein
MSKVTHNQMYEEALKSPSSTIDLLVERPEDGDPNLTFSMEALENVRDAAMTWIGTRAIRAMRAGKPPQKMKATLTVTFDDDEPVVVPPSERPFFIAAGKHRVN